MATDPERNEEQTEVGTSGELRAAARVACDVPILLDPQDRKMPARIVDVSRTGLRIRIEDHELGLHRLSPIRQVAERMLETVGDEFEAHLHHEMLGALISHPLHMVRIASRDWETTSVEIGCVILDGPLRDEAISMLGLALPEIGATDVPEALSAVEAPTARVGRFESPKADPVASTPSESVPMASHRARCRYRAALGTTSSSRSAPPLRGIAESLSPLGSRVRLTNLEELGFETPPSSVAEVILALDHRFGERVALKLTDGADHLWTGPTRVAQVELPPNRPGQAVLDVGFERPLRPAERRKLRI